MKINRGIVKTLLLFVALLAVFVGAVLVPYGLYEAKLNEQIHLAQQELGIGEVDNAGMVRLYKQVQALRDQLGGRGQYIPDEDELSLVLRDLSGLINAPGVSGQEIVTEKSKLYADYNILPIRIQFQAPFATAFDLVERIESLSRVVRVDQLVVEAEPDYPSQPLVVSLDLSAFFASRDREGRL